MTSRQKPLLLRTGSGGFTDARRDLDRHHGEHWPASVNNTYRQHLDKLNDTYGPAFREAVKCGAAICTQAAMLS